MQMFPYAGSAQPAPFFSESAVEMLGSAFDVINESQRQWGSEIEFISATDSSVRGLRAVAMSYIASDGAQQRKRKARSEGKGGSARGWRGMDRANHGCVASIMRAGAFISTRRPSRCCSKIVSTCAMFAPRR